MSWWSRLRSTEERLELIERELHDKLLVAETALMAAATACVGGVFAPVEREDERTGAQTQRVLAVRGARWGGQWTGESAGMVYVDGVQREVDGGVLRETRVRLPMTRLIGSWYRLGPEWTEERISDALAAELRRVAARATEEAARVSPKRHTKKA